MASQWIIVTGCSKGLGLEMVRSFVTLGHNVIGCARNAKAMADLQKEFGSPHSFTAVDVTDADGVEAWAD
ncbi:MAG: SDR family NAD(P)-dependent oxidoreductase, partial [Verrucomicrobia bacterium]|nr:SDR family NAD(P)-dependent oxidoreductase [Verrucomicrobiota bacterium]